MANAFVKAQFMEPPDSGVDGAVPIGAVKAGPGITISNDGIISLDGGSGIINEIICTNGIVGGGSSPQVIIALAPPTDTTIGGVRTVPGSNLSIDSEGVIRADANFSLTGGLGVIVTQTSPDSAQVAVKPAGSSNPVNLGGIYRAGGDFNGLSISPDGGLSLLPATATRLGGIKPGTGVSITGDGTLNATGTGGTITGVGAGTGLAGGGTTGAVTLYLRAATPTTIGGVYPGDNVTVDPDGKLNVSDAALGVLTVNSTPGSAIVVDNADPTNPLVGVTVASTGAVGVTQLSSALDSTAEDQAATPAAVKTAYDLALGALPLTGGSMLGPITFTAGQTFPDTIPPSAFTGLGAILVGSSTGTGYESLVPGNEGQVLTVSGAAPLGVEWRNTVDLTPDLQFVTDNGATTTNAVTIQNVPNNSTTVIDGRSITLTTTNPLGQTFTASLDSGYPRLNLSDTLSISTAGTTATIQTFTDAQSLNIDSNNLSFRGKNLSVVANLTPTLFQVNAPFKAGGVLFPTSDGSSNQALTTNGSGQLGWTSVLPLSGGSLSGLVTFAAGQSFPGVLTQGALSANSPLVVGGTISNPILSVDTATTSALGVVRPDGTTIAIDGDGIISVANAGGSSLPLTGGTMTGDIVFAGTQTFPSTISEALLTATGDILYASAAGTAASLPIGAAGTILAVNSGLPSWRTAAQLQLLTATAAATTYAPIDSPTFTGPVTVNGGGSAGANAMTISGGNLVLATAFTPTSSSSTGSVGELAWDTTGYLYFCYAPNTWGRVQIDLNPF